MASFSRDSKLTTFLADFVIFLVFAYHNILCQILASLFVILDLLMGFSGRPASSTNIGYSTVICFLNFDTTWYLNAIYKVQTIQNQNFQFWSVKSVYM